MLKINFCNTVIIMVMQIKLLLLLLKMQQGPTLARRMKTACESQVRGSHGWDAVIPASYHADEGRTLRCKNNACHICELYLEKNL